MCFEIGAISRFTHRSCGDDANVANIQTGCNRAEAMKGLQRELFAGGR